VPKEKAGATTDLVIREEVRSRPAVKLILSELEERKEAFAIGGEVIDTIFGYNRIAPELPEDVNFHPGDRKSVDQIHESYRKLQSMSDFVSTKYLEAKTRIRIISKIERQARNDVIASDHLKRSSTGPTTDKTMQFVLPELYEQKDKWENFRDLCKHVLGRLRDAMFLLKNELKAEEIFRSLPRV
jgi:hypothetical protein